MIVASAAPAGSGSARAASFSTSTAKTGAAQTPLSAKPDIIFVTLDTVRADHTSVYGYGKATTPNLDELAKKGVVFEHAYATGGDTQRALTPLVSGRRLPTLPAINASGRRSWPRPTRSPSASSAAATAPAR